MTEPPPIYLDKFVNRHSYDFEININPSEIQLTDIGKHRNSQIKLDASRIDQVEAAIKQFRKIEKK